MAQEHEFIEESFEGNDPRMHAAPLYVGESNDKLNKKRFIVRFTNGRYLDLYLVGDPMTVEEFGYALEEEVQEYVGSVEREPR